MIIWFCESCSTEPALTSDSGQPMERICSHHCLNHDIKSVKHTGWIQPAALLGDLPSSSAKCLGEPRIAETPATAQEEAQHCNSFLSLQPSASKAGLFPTRSQTVQSRVWLAWGWGDDVGPIWPAGPGLSHPSSPWTGPAPLLCPSGPREFDAPALH